MKVSTQWTEKMAFKTSADGHQASMDAKAPLGSDSALTPKQYLIAAVCGCTGMDVVALLKKYKQPLKALEVIGDARLTEGVHPAVFKEFELVFNLDGDLDPTKVLEAVHLSQTKYCGVSAMVSKAVPISYTVFLNGSEIGKGKADF